MEATVKINMEQLADSIRQVHQYFHRYVIKQVNISLTLRNWIIGYMLVEYELSGSDRAAYGKKLFKEIAHRIKEKGIKQIRERHLYLCKDFYNCYPYILRSATAKSYLSEIQDDKILLSLTAKLSLPELNKDSSTSLPAPEQSDFISGISPDVLINNLSFTHIIELLNADTQLKRSFYEGEAIKNNWTVRELERAMNSMLFERTGLSTNKEPVLEKHRGNSQQQIQNILRNPYVLEFLDLEEKPEYSESDLEQAIINHLHDFLIEMGHGFCLEARQKRITFDNTHYRIDLVFYQRLLKCHVLIDLKLGKFTHADAGQMNVYLNYYKENEMFEGDNPPVGIILCATRNANLVKYATAGLPQQIFVSKYMVNLPKEEELIKIIEEEQKKLMHQV